MMIDFSKMPLLGTGVLIRVSEPADSFCFVAGALRYYRASSQTLTKIIEVKSLKSWHDRRGGTIRDFVFPNRIDYLGHLSTWQSKRSADIVGSNIENTASYLGV
tara:strand:+ start:2884 stop:3195 length:312 start_codon:yes stop_codon:yes gene_type:complete